MLKEEAVWIGRQLRQFNPDALSPMCNLGSSTLHFRTAVQPYIDKELFAPAREAGLEVIHVDLKAASGVDIVGDYLDSALVAKLRKREFRSVMCCNLLEHVKDRQKLVDLVTSLVQPGGIIIVSVPNFFPYHEDPIDTLFRPDLDEVKDLFKDLTVVAAKVVRASRFRHDLGGDWRRAFWLAVRVCVPFYRPRRWVVSARALLELWRGYRVTCAILCRQQPARLLPSTRSERHR